MIGGIATGLTKPQEPTDLLLKKFLKTSSTPILKAPNDDCFVVTEDLNDFKLKFSVPLCISLSTVIFQDLHYCTECTGQLL